jgi:hypothetical protein
LHRNKRLRLFTFALLITTTTGCTEDELPLGGWVTVKPAEIDFGRVRVGAFDLQEVTVRNRRSTELVVDIVRRPDGHPDIWALESKLTLAAGASERLELAFEPEAEGVVEATFDFVPTDGSPLASVDAQGEGQASFCDPMIDGSELSFGNVVVGTRDVLTVPIDNCDSEPLTLEIIRETNVRDCILTNDPATFCLEAGSGSIVIEPGAHLDLEVTFSPTIAGTRERGSFVLAHCDRPECETEIIVSGLGVESGLRCTPEILDFASVSPGYCAFERVTCENLANETVTVAGWQVVPSGPSNDETFEAETPSARVVLEEGESFEIEVAFCPTSLGQKTAQLSIETTNADPVHRYLNVPLEGDGGGPDIEALPTGCIDFGRVSTRVPVQRSVLLRNGGVGPGEVTQVNVDVEGTGAFSSPNAQAAVLQPGDALSFHVEFAPPQAGPYESSMTILVNDPDEPAITVCLRGEGVDLPSCSYALSPSSIDFGNAPLERTHTRAVELRNTGQSDCLVNQAALQPGTDAPFALVDPPDSVLVPAGESHAIEVAYTPRAAASSTGEVLLWVSSTETPIPVIGLAGAAQERPLVVEPSEVRFGRVPGTCTTPTRSIRLHNASAVPLDVDAITVEADADFSVTLPTLPVELAPGASLVFDATYQPRSSGDHAGAIRIDATDGDGALVRYVSLRGARAPNGQQVDAFTDVGKGPADVLFVLDTSGSMSTERAAMAKAVNEFLSYVESNTVDYQVGVITADAGDLGRLIHPSGGNNSGGAAANKIITRASRNPSGLLYMALDPPMGASSVEMGLWTSVLGLSGASLTGYNLGFLRPEASLNVIYMIDSEEEQSPHTSGLYADFLRALKPGRPFSVSASALADLSPPLCNGPGSPVTNRQIEVARATGGIVDSLCGADLSRMMTDLGTRAFGFTRSFPLTAPPVLPLVVEVDGLVLLPNTEYDYDAFNRRVTISEALIAPGADVTIRYAAACQ